jgi:hypothetical protein
VSKPSALSSESSSFVLFLSLNKNLYNSCPSIASKLILIFLSIYIYIQDIKIMARINKPQEQKDLEVRIRKRIMSFRDPNNGTRQPLKKKSLDNYTYSLAKYCYDKDIKLSDLFKDTAGEMARIFDTRKAQGANESTTRVLLQAVGAYTNRKYMAKPYITLCNITSNDKYDTDGYAGKKQDLIKAPDVHIWYNKLYAKVAKIMEEYRTKHKYNLMTPTRLRDFNKFVLFWLLFMNIPRRNGAYLGLVLGPERKNLKLDKKVVQEAGAEDSEDDSVEDSVDALTEKIFTGNGPRYNFLDMNYYNITLAEPKESKLILNRYKTFFRYNRVELQLFNYDIYNLYKLPVKQTTDAINFWQRYIYTPLVEDKTKDHYLLNIMTSSGIARCVSSMTSPGTTIGTIRKSVATYYITDVRKLKFLSEQLGHNLQTHIGKYLLNRQYDEMVPEDKPDLENLAEVEPEDPDKSDTSVSDKPDMEYLVQQQRKEKAVKTRLANKRKKEKALKLIERNKNKPAFVKKDRPVRRVRMNKGTGFSDLIDHKIDSDEEALYDSMFIEAGY